ncbi:MAG: flippase-like domain-containing protein, partial [Candidatus Diapherotrites archaeon]|nr:flippase-like domain-containing protein [Candidatus Diapherotrites archaeon]
LLLAIISLPCITKAVDLTLFAVFIILLLVFFAVVFLSRKNTIISDFSNTILALAKSRMLLPCFAATLIYIIFSFFSTFFVFLIFGEFVKLPLIAVATTIAMFAGFASMIPGGLGVREGSAAIIFSSFGINFKIASAATVLGRIISLPFIALGAFLFFSKSSLAIQKFYLKKR